MLSSVGAQGGHSQLLGSSEELTVGCLGHTVLIVGGGEEGVSILKLFIVERYKYT